MVIKVYQESRLPIDEMLLSGVYNTIRSHHYFVWKLAEALNLDIEDYFKSSPEILDLEGTDLGYTLKEVNKYPLINSSNKYIGALLQCRITKENRNEILEFMRNSYFFFYYCTDTEYSGIVMSEEDMLLKHIEHDKEMYDIFVSKCIFIMNGLYNMTDQIVYHHPNIPVYYFPQIINPNFPRIEREKKYDVCVLNNSKEYYRGIKYLLDNGVSVKNMIIDVRATIPGATNIMISRGAKLIDLINEVAECRYYAFTNTSFGQSKEDWYMMYATYSISFKLFESYAGHCIPFPGSYLPDRMVNCIKRSKDLYNELDEFDNWIEGKLSLDTFRETFNKIINEIQRLL